MKADIINSVNKFIVTVNTRKRINGDSTILRLADYIDQYPDFNVTEVRMCWGKNEVYIYIYPNNPHEEGSDTEAKLKELIDDYIAGYDLFE